MPKRRYYGWRGKGVPDARDHRYAAPQAVLNALPRKVNLAIPSPGAPFDPAYDQLQLGACGPGAVAKLITFLQLKKAGAGAMPSRLFLYWIARVLMGTTTYDSGVENLTMFKALSRYGWCDESLWPYDITRYTQPPPPACFTQASGRKPPQYLEVTQSLDQIKGCLAAGTPFVFGFAVYSSFESDQVEATGDVPMPNTSTEDLEGGHDILIVGYDDDTQMLDFANDWGGDWGSSGYGRIPYAYALDPKLSGDFRTINDPGWTPAPPAPPVGSLRLVVPQTLAAGTYNLSPQ